MHDNTTGGHTHEHQHEHDHDHVVTADGQLTEPGERIEPGEIWERGNEFGKLLWIDASQGASGDMLLGALLDAGADAGSVAAVLELVAPGKLHLQSRKVQRGAFTANKVDVIADEPNPPARGLADIEHMLSADGIPQQTHDLALDAFRRLAAAEAHVHGTTIDQVHFHEVGALDSIGDIVGVAEAIRTLHVDAISCSTVALGAGTVQTQHGLLTVPPPAVLELSRDWLVEAGGPADVGELCTPTGLALLRAMCDKQESMPQMTLSSVGIGAGTRIRKDRAGILRAITGDHVPDHIAPIAGAQSPCDIPPSEIHEVFANVDDMDPRVWPAVIDRLLDAGAVDAWLVPIIMKKGRPAHTITALTPVENVQYVTDALVTHTSTIGVRVTAPMHRRVLHRIWVPIEVEGVQVRIKVSGQGPDCVIQQATAEFVDVEELANKTGVAQRVALAQAQSVAWEAGLYPGAPWPEKEQDD